MTEAVRAIMKNFHLLLLAFNVYLFGDAAFEHFDKYNQIESRIPELEKGVADAAKKKSDVQKFLQDLEESKAKVEMVAREVEGLMKKLPNDSDDRSIIDTMTIYANEFNLNALQIRPGAEKVTDFYFTKEVKLTGPGTFLQFVVFLENLGNKDRIYNVPSVTFAQDLSKKVKGRHQIVSMDASVELYRFNPAYKEDRGHDKIENQAKEIIKPKFKPKPKQVPSTRVGTGGEE